MDELPFKIVRMQGSRDEVIARLEKAAFEKALFVFGCPPGSAPGGRGSF